VSTPESELRAAIDASNGDPIPRPLALQVWLPVRTDAYRARLEREMDLVARHFDRDRVVIRIGFSAPKPVEPGAVSDLLYAIRAQFHCSVVMTDACGDGTAGIGGSKSDTDCDQIGFGVGAVSRIGDCTFRNVADLAVWERAIDAGRLPVGPAGRIAVTSHGVATTPPTFNRDRR
jgi:hypothetical protein